MDSPYKGDFASWADVAAQFGSGEPGGGFSWGKAIKTIAGAPDQEPEEVLLARYDNEAYEGDAIVIYRQGDKVFEVTGAHCSCYGLEGQWEPEEYDIAVYLAAKERLGYRKDEDMGQVVERLRSRV